MKATLSIAFAEAAAATKGQISMNPDIYGGVPCIAGTRVPVYVILDHLASGYSIRRIIKGFPITADDVLAALTFAKILTEC